MKCLFAVKIICTGLVSVWGIFFAAKRKDNRKISRFAGKKSFWKEENEIFGSLLLFCQPQYSQTNSVFPGRSKFNLKQFTKEFHKSFVTLISLVKKGTFTPVWLAKQGMMTNDRFKCVTIPKKTQKCCACKLTFTGLPITKVKHLKLLAASSISTLIFRACLHTRKHF